MKKSGNNNPATSEKQGEVIEGELIEKESVPADTEEQTVKKPAEEPVEKPVDKPVDKQAKEEKSAESPKKAPPKEPEQPVKKHPARKNWTSKIALLVAIIALLAVGYLYWLQLQTSSAIEKHQANATADLTTLNQSQQKFTQQLSALNQKLNTVQSNAANEQSSIAELQNRLTRSIQQVMAEQKNTQEDWLLAEVEYLLRLSNQRVLMEQTPQGALQLLRSADKILSESDDVTLYEIRKAVAADIAALEAVPELDTEGVFLRLGALSAQIDQLQVVPLTEQHKLPELVNEVTSDEFASTWGADMKQAWATVVDKLDQLVVIQDRSEPVEPLLSPQQSYYLQQNLHLMLEQAQLSLLQHKPKSYLNSLTKAQQWVSTYFEQNHSNTKALLKALKDLEQVQVAPQMPDISGSLATLKNHLKQMRKLKEGAA